MKVVIDFFSDVRAELLKVNWPTRKEVIKMTVLVIIATIVVGAYVGILDVALTKLIETIV